jgi:hypothetical protein
MQTDLNRSAPTVNKLFLPPVSGSVSKEREENSSAQTKHARVFLIFFCPSFQTLFPGSAVPKYFASQTNYHAA